MSKLLQNNEILLRALEPEDLDILYEWENDTDLWKYGSSLSPFSRFALRQYLIYAQQDIYQTKQLRLMIVLREDNRRIGTVDLYDFEPFHGRAGVGILLDQKYRNQGYGFKSLELLEEYAFNFLKLHQLYAFIPEPNVASIRLFKKAEFECTAILKDWMSLQQVFVNVFVMQKFNTGKNQ